MAKFQKGHPGGPGRPKRQTEVAYLAVTMAACPLEAWREIVDVAVRDAKNGDAAARAWLGRYLVGDPATKAPAPTTVIVHELLADDPAMDRAVSIVASNLDFPNTGANPESARRARLMIEGGEL